jgi:hypothetical protein
MNRPRPVLAASLHRHTIHAMNRDLSRDEVNYICHSE